MLARINRWLRPSSPRTEEPEAFAHSDFSWGTDTDYCGGDVDVSLKKKFIIDPDFAHRFNAYATACFPNEIGAVVRIVERQDAFVAVDFAVLPQSVSSAYFEFTTEGQAQFQMDLATSGRGPELAEWYGLIHSHPNMTPFMSSTDVDNLWKLAGNKCGFSLICAAHSQPDNNYFSVNYAQGGPVPLMIKRLAHNSSADLGGTGELTAEELETIAADVAEKTRRRGSDWYGSEYCPGPSNNRPLAASEPTESKAPSAPASVAAQQVALPGLEEEWFANSSDLIELARGADNGVEDGEILVPALAELEASELIIGALRLAEDLEIASAGQSAEINRRIALQEGLTITQADILVIALAEYPDNGHEDSQDLVQDLIDQLSEKIDAAEEW